MKIEFIKDYKTIKKGTEYKFPDFTVLTGKNGAGKTNLLEGILTGNGDVLIDSSPRYKFQVEMFNFNSFDRKSTPDFCGLRFNNDLHANILWKAYPELPDSGIIRWQRDFEEIAKYNKKKVDELSEKDFKNYPLNRNRYNEKLELFDLKFFQDIATYLGYRERNIYNDFKKEKYNDKNLIYTSEEFQKSFGPPPWEIINKIFRDNDLNYQVVVSKEVLLEEKLEIKLKDTINNIDVNVIHMSSGERTILAIISFIYNATFFDEIPDIFLFDEPDALLHPEYSSKLVKILNSYIVNQLGKKVIMTTHSPSTIALVPNKSIFICERKSFKIVKVNKDHALNILTSNINALSINYENRRQVFVEDKSDVFVFEKVKSLLKDKLKQDISLNFISIAKTGNGGCDKVKDIVNSLYKFGNRSTFGIIDWDLKNNDGDSVFVLGNGKRYNIENYIFDPILVYAFLLRRKVIPKREVLNFGHSYVGLKELELKQLQTIVNEITNLCLPLKPTKSIEGNQIIDYVNGKQVEVPKWFLQTNGKHIIKQLEEVFPELIGIKQKEKKTIDKLIINEVFEDYPEYLSTDFIGLFLKIQQK